MIKLASSDPFMKTASGFSNTILNEKPFNI